MNNNENNNGNNNESKRIEELVGRILASKGHALLDREIITLFLRSVRNRSRFFIKQGYLQSWHKSVEI